MENAGGLLQLTCSLQLLRLASGRWRALLPTQMRMNHSLAPEVKTI
ncbi:MAG: hypothetical protein LBF67_09400 [Prevotellaceae bacterium]|nr:hypothetical protein [Prevotellaceae bacterium]